MSPLAPTSVSRASASTSITGYRLEKVVGSGGMGEVHRAEQVSLGRTVAVKVLSAELAKDGSFVSRFRKEAAALAAMRYPHIVSIVDQGETAGGVPFLVMEFVEGPSLREVMRSPLFDVPTALRIFNEVARAIDYAHRRNVIHRDLKPENILLDEQAGGIAKVGDFGLAAFVEDEPTRFNLTQTHMAMGTLAYMAPEQRLDAKSADGRADLYSLGVLLYEMLTGQTPVGTFEPASVLKPGLDPRLDAVIARCLRPDPKDRFASVAALLEMLEPLLPRNAPVVAPVIGPGGRLVRSIKRAVRNALTAAAALLVALTAALLLIVWPRLMGEAPVPPEPDDLLGGTGLGAARPLSGQGRLEESGRSILSSLQAPGPDNIPLLVSGRGVVQESKALVFAAPEDAVRAGRVVLDTSEVPAEALEWSAVAQTQSVGVDDAWERVQRLLRGPREPSRAALMLMGDPGRYVALVVAEDEREATISWALGQRRGRMRAPVGLSAAEPLQLSLDVDEGGELRAHLGEGKNRRAVGEPLQLGERWTRHFGRLPQPAVGCFEGTCRFENARFTVRRPAPPPVQQPVVTAPPPAPRKVAAPVKRKPPTRSNLNTSTQRRRR